MKMWQAVAVVVVLVVAVGAAFMFKDKVAPPEATVAGETYQISFICDDTSHFIAHFTAAGTVQIDVDGEIVQELPLASSSSGTLYTNNDWSLLLKGERATVTRVSDGQSGSCQSS